MNTTALTAVSIAVALALLGCTDANPEERLASAKEYLQKNDTKAAVIEIKNALQKNPDLGEARYLLGSTLLKDGNAVAAEVELRKALAAKYPQEVVVPDLARSMLMLGQAKKVVDEFGTTRLGKPAADASLQSTLTMAYAALGKPEQAQAALSAALAAEPTHAPALLLSARQKAASRDFDGAMALLDEVIAREPANTEAWKLKGDLLLYVQNKPDDALVAYRKALEINPKLAPAHMAILSVLMRQNKLDEATKQLEQLKTFAAKNPQTKFAEAQLAYQKKDFKLAKDLAQQLLQLAPKDPRILQLAGAVELRMGSVAQAEIYLSNALQLAPGLSLARRLLIVAYLRSGQPAQALAALTAAEGKDGLPPGLYSLAGEVYLQNGDAKKAEEYFAKALKLDPDDARKRTALAITQLASGQTEAGLDELHSIAESDPGATADLALISAHLRRQEFDKALAAIDKLEAKQPDKPVAANLRGRVQLLQKNNAAARKSFEKALAIDPSFFAAAASLASMDLADKKPEEARKRFEGVLAKNPKNGQALLALAQLAAVSGGNKDEVAALLTKAIDANPTEIAPRLLLIDLHLRNKDNKQALAVAQSAATALPNSPEILAALGRTQQVSGDLNQAIATYGKLIAMQPLSPQPHIRLAEAQVANKDNRAAEQSLRKALEIKPDLLDAQRGLIMLLIESKKYQDAITIARRVQEQMPKNAIGYVLEGDINLARKDWDAAAKAYNLGLRQVQASILAIKLHAVLTDAGKTADADRYAATWIKAQPKDAGFLTYLGGVALERKDYVAAQRSYQAVLKIQPDNALVLNNLAWISKQTGGKDALALAQRANELVPNQPAFMDTLALILTADGDHAKAIDLQLKALSLQPESATMRLNLAKMYIAAGDKAKARTELETLAKLDDKHPLHAEVSALLKAL
jgi:putative PEP-CTERM system TPR-repeat lipoprotein